ncbi:MAG: HisA/HisF-related TIM barrel protein, partial [Acutalibacteraceae bacterium]|nr:HisA/HisF-related TIM barrel protein [Acutalibacteraceae bacterium]
RDSVKRFGNRVAVGVDIKDGYVATHGWTKASALTCDDFVRQLCDIGVDTIICTDISKDGMLSGTNLELYRTLNDKFDINITASGGVSTLDDVAALKNMNMYGAILGKALYTGGIDLKSAVELAAE